MDVGSRYTVLKDKYKISKKKKNLWNSISILTLNPTLFMNAFKMCSFRR